MSVCPDNLFALAEFSKRISKGNPKKAQNWAEKAGYKMAVMVEIPQAEASAYGLDKGGKVTLAEFTALQEKRAELERIERNRAELTKRLDAAVATRDRRKRLYDESEEAVATAEENLRTGNLPKRGRPSNGDESA
jgi:superfamily II RNA helicase